MRKTVTVCMHVLPNDHVAVGRRVMTSNNLLYYYIVVIQNHDYDGATGVRLTLHIITIDCLHLGVL